MPAPSAAERAARDAEALKLRHVGVAPSRIAEQLGFKTTKQADEAIERALDSRGASLDPDLVRRLEVDRLDRLQEALWGSAVDGDRQSIETLVKLGQERVRLAGIAARGESVMTDSFDATVATLMVQPQDTSIIASGRRICERIDTAAASGDVLAETKALYLLPHLMNILRELGATPAARADLKAQAPSGNNDKRAKLQALRAPKAS